MNNLILLITIASVSSLAFSQSSPKHINSLPNKEVTVTGKLEDGKIINDLSWAWNSSVACFPATQQKSFNGNHVLFETILPKRAIMTITLIPKDPNSKMSVYGYSVGVNSNVVVPKLYSCVSCEVDNNQMGKDKDNTRSIRLNAINNPYKVYIGVVGENGLQKGDFTLTIKLEGGEEKSLAQTENVVVKNCKTPEKGKVLIYKDDIKNGVVIPDLSWAWNSSVACFPETQKENYTGKHILFKTEISKYSIMSITLIPTNPTAKLSLYGYQVGLTNESVVPKLYSCVSCEADNNQMGKATNNQRSISFTAINHPYKIMIGVAGATGLKEGKFTLKIELKDR